MHRSVFSVTVLSDSVATLLTAETAADGIVDKIFTTNLIYRNPDLATREWYCEVDMSKYISLLIDTLNHDETISSLLNPVTKIKNLISKLENK